MKLLLDTHALIWLVENDARLSPGARQAVADRIIPAISPATVCRILQDVDLLQRLAQLLFKLLDPFFCRHCRSLSDQGHSEQFPY